MSDVSILLVGDLGRSEFQDARTVLERWGRVVDAPDADAAADVVRDGKIVPDVIAIAQSHPAQFSHQSVDRLRRLAPLARVVGLLGSWCEGEMRTGKPWPGAVRLYWHQWSPHCDRQLRRMSEDRCSTWGLPITATDEERLLLASDEPPSHRQGLIAIHTNSYVMEDWLSAALRSRGCSTVWLRPPRPAQVEGAVAAIFDGSDCRREQLDELKHLAETLAPAPIVALLDFPRIEDRQRALAAGAQAVLSKPLQVDDLFWELDRVLEESGENQ